MSYDQGYWHTDACNEKGLPEENAGTHISVYVRWCIERNLIAEQFALEDEEALSQVRAGTLSAASYFSEYMDWKLGDWNLNDVGNAFTQTYYQNYLADLERLFPDVVYGDWAEIEFEKLASLLDQRFDEYQSGRLPGASGEPKPWWKIW